MSEAGSQISRASSVTLLPNFSSPSTAVKTDNTSIFGNPLVPASSAIEYVASRADQSSTVYVFDLAEQVGFGTLTKEWSGKEGTSPVVPLQTRAGTGLSLVGRLSEGTSQDTVKGAVLTAYASLSGLSLMAPALSYLPPASANSRLVIQIPVLSPVGDNLALAPSIAPLATVLPIIPSNVVVLVSGTPKEAVDFAQLTYKLKSSHAIHLFDQYSAGREVGQQFHELSSVGEADDVTALLHSAGYAPFSYYGASDADIVLVLMNGPLAQLTKAYVDQSASVGLVIVSALRPFDDEALKNVVPPSTRAVYVVDEVPNKTTHGILFSEVLGSLIGTSFKTFSRRIVPTDVLSFVTDTTQFQAFIEEFAPAVKEAAIPASGKKILFVNTPQTPFTAVPFSVESVFTAAPNLAARLLVDHDVFSKAGGISAARILLSSQTSRSEVPISFISPIDKEAMDFIVVTDQNLLKTHEVVKNAKAKSAILVGTGWTPAELLASLPSGAPAQLLEKQVYLYTVDAKAIASSISSTNSGPVFDALQAYVVHLTFLRLYLGQKATEGGVLTVARAVKIAEEDSNLDLEKVNAKVWEALVEIDLPASLPSPDAPTSSPVKSISFNAVSVETEVGDVVNGAFLGSWHDAAKHLIFPSAFTPEDSSEAFGQIAGLRPEVTDKTFLVTTSVNRRLTPLEYDRNVFHLEFDTSGTGLKYEIGEALGVHGWNDEDEVKDFCNWYGVDPNRLITIPVPGGEGKMHTRTVFQALQQQIDLFGKPPKSFFTDLAPYASSNVDRHALLFIGSPEGISTFKKYSEKDTVTFAEVLQMYPSARPGIEVLCELVGDIKPRHYSIASSQAVVGDRVDLLVVTVDWVTPSGSPRYGQCTKYLAGLKVGQKVTVSIKPSVMKLPASDKQPLIMAGLGTGAAPFRAFLQYRALQRTMGEEVGPVYYYFGSRHQSQEYLYGEEIEAFITDSVITRAGLAFSRDGPKKVYIQHKMLEDSKELAEMLSEEEKGVFYLCGPTWPVPDVYEALVNALVEYKGYTAESAGEYLESLKEEERYVLEVY